MQYGQYGELDEGYIIYSLYAMLRIVTFPYNINGETLKDSNLSRAVMADWIVSFLKRFPQEIGSGMERCLQKVVERVCEGIRVYTVTFLSQWKSKDWPILQDYLSWGICPFYFSNKMWTDPKEQISLGRRDSALSYQQTPSWKLENEYLCL